jgi:hypothetical protein
MALACARRISRSQATARFRSWRTASAVRPLADALADDVEDLRLMAQIEVRRRLVEQ